MTKLDTSRPVLMIDGASRGDIGLIRSLGFGGVPVHLLASDQRSPSARSRFVAGVHPSPGLGAPDERLLDSVGAAARALGTRPVMLASGDTALAFLSRCRSELRQFVDHDLAPTEVIATCLDKSRFAEAAARLSLPVPLSHAPDSVSEARALAPTLRFPVFVKPVDRAEWDRLPPGTVDQVKGQRVDDLARLERLLDALEAAAAGRFVIQSFVAGSDAEHMSVHAYVLPDGRVAGTFTGAKLRIWPPHAGVGAQVLSRRMPEVVPIATAALNALGYTGFAILQFKRNTATGGYELLEINCRYSTWTELPSRAGCNFPLAAYATITGQPLPPLVQREGLSWLDLERDLSAMATYRAAGEWTWGGYLRSLVTVRCWAYFAWDDPGPFLTKVMQPLRARFGH